MVVRMVAPEVAAVDAELGRLLDNLERAREQLQAIDYQPLRDPAMGYRVPQVLGLWDKVRGTVSDLLAALPPPGGKE